MDDQQMTADESISGRNQTVFERDGKWYWYDEIYDEHGPCFSRESACSRQSLYCHWLQGTGDLDFVTADEWHKSRERESEDTNHPCDNACAWECMCAGSCGCHWKERVNDGRLQ